MEYIHSVKIDIEYRSQCSVSHMMYPSVCSDLTGFKKKIWIRYFSSLVIYPIGFSLWENILEMKFLSPTNMSTVTEEM